MNSEVQMRKKHKILTYCMIGTFALASQNTVIKAEETPIAGIDVMLYNFFQNVENDVDVIEDFLLAETVSPYRGISFAQVANYVNIRNTPSEEGEILGKLYHNFSATIINQVDDWYQVQSGSVTGYIKGEYLVIGEEAQQLAEKLVNRIARVNATTLKVRESASLESVTLTLVPNGTEFIVKEVVDGWAKIVLDENRMGYVSTDYVEIRAEYDEAESIEEEQERIAAEQARIVAEQERIAAEQARKAAEQERIAEEKARKAAEQARMEAAAREKANAVKKAPITNSVNNTTNAKTSSIRKQIVNYALRFEGNPYKWAGTSLTNGADCSGYTQSIFRDNGIRIPRDSRSQAASGRRVTVNTMQPGDLIFYDRNGTINHVGIYIGNGKVISSSSEKHGVRITRYDYRRPVKVVSYINN